MPHVDLSAARRAGIDAFGEAILYTRQGEPTPKLISGVFTGVHEAISIGAELGISSTQPKLGVDLAELPGTVPDPKERIGDTFEREDGSRFEVIDVEEDGHGGADLILHRAPAA